MTHGWALTRPGRSAWRDALALVRGAFARIPEGATRCAEVRRATDVSVLACVPLEPGGAPVRTRAAPSRQWITGESARLAFAISLQACRAVPTMPFVALARAGASV